MTIQNLADCLPDMSPCDALSLLRKVRLQYALHGHVTSVKFGQSQYNVSSVSMSGLESLISEYDALCNGATGLSGRFGISCVAFGRCGQKYRKGCQ